MGILKKIISIVSICFSVLVVFACIVSNSDSNENNTPNQNNNPAENVTYISQRQTWYQDENNRHVLVFSLLDKNNNELKAPATVTIRIENNNGEEVYSATKEITTSDYTTWSYSNGAVKKLQATIYINNSEIKQGTISTGKIHFEVVNTGYFNFDTSTLNISDLPTKEAVVILPELPQTISYSSTTIFKVTDIKFEINYDSYSYMFITGEKLYDKKGDNYSRGCKIGWKLYDSEGYIIDSGTETTQAINVGEKIKEQKFYVCHQLLIPGETYTLEILNVA